MLRSQPYDIMAEPCQFAWDSQQFTTIQLLQNFRGFFTTNIISLLFPIVLLSTWYRVSRDCTMEILPQPLVYCCSTSTRSYAKILEDRKSEGSLIYLLSLAMAILLIPKLPHSTPHTKDMQASHTMRLLHPYNTQNTIATNTHNNHS
jgi:hypothetical protein